MKMKDRRGQKVRMILKGKIYYSGEILSEDENLIVIRDKFGKEVSIGKAAIVSMEVMDDGNG